MLSSFLQVLLTALIQKSHDLLQEEIIAAIYSMVSSNFDAFFMQFVPNFLMNLQVSNTTVPLATVWTVIVGGGGMISGFWFFIKAFLSIYYTLPPI